MRICIYGASSAQLDKAYFDAARELGALLAAGGHQMVFGGGQTGLMGACAEGARNKGAAILGVAPRFFDEPGILDPRCSEFFFTETIRERKQLMEEKSEAFIVLPGGIGTLEEFFEILTLKQLGRHGKPIAVLNTLGYYDRMLAMLENTAEQGFMSRSCLALFALCAQPADALRHVEQTPPLRSGSPSLTDYSK